MADPGTIKEIISEVDTDNVSFSHFHFSPYSCCLFVVLSPLLCMPMNFQDGRINYEEFCTMMRTGNTKQPNILF